MRNKRGWLKLVEAGLAIVLLASVLLITYINNNVGSSQGSFLLDYEEDLLHEISLNDSLRDTVLTCSSGELVEPNAVFLFLNKSLPSNIGFKVSCCELGGSCGNLTSSLDLTRDIEKSIFVRERLIGSNEDIYSPKILSIYAYLK